MDGLARRLIDHAALSGPFEPRRFLYAAASPAEVSAALGALAPLCEEVTVGDRQLWSMRGPDRVRALRGLAARPEAMRRLWRKRPPLAEDAFARALRDCLTGAALRPEAYGEAALREAIGAAILAGAMLAAPRKAEVAAFERGLYRRAVEMAQAARLRAVLPHPLEGREAERAAVLAFLERGEALAPARPLGGVPATRLILTGPPGMGKSAFLADLLHGIAAGPGPAWVVAFDFDQLTLTRGGAIAWTEELTRQLAAQAPEIGAALSEIRSRHARLRGETAGGAPETEAERLLAEVGGVLAALPRRPLVLIADTIEEITAQDAAEQFAVAPRDTVFHEVLTWAERLGAGPAPVFAPVRLVMAGRTAPPVSDAVLAEWFGAALELPELDDAAAGALLRDRDASLPPALCARIVQAVGGHPLHLLLVQKHLSALPRRSRPALVREIEAEGLRGAGSAAVVRALYSRFLDRLRIGRLPEGLTAADIRRLAHPGLVLRQVTAPLLAEVVAPAAGVDLPAAAAGDALKALGEQVWMVAAGDEPGSLRHRPDVRRVMLPLMLGSDDPAVVAVLDRAIAWHEAQGGARSREEAGYLRALRGDVAAFEADPSLAASVLSVTGGDLELMPLRAQAMLKFHADHRPPLTAGEIATLPEPLQVEASLRQRSEALRKYGGGSGASEVPRPFEELLNVSFSVKGPQAARPAFEDAFAPPPSAASPAMAGAEPPGDVLDWIGSTGDAYEVLNDPRLDRAVEIAFLEADFAGVSRLGWAAVARIGTWPDLARPLGLRAAFHESWLWRTALASAVAPPPGDPRAAFPAEVLAEIGRAGEEDWLPLEAAAYDLDLLLGLASPAGTETAADPAAREIAPADFRQMRLLAAAPALRRRLPGAALRLPAIAGALPLLAEGLLGAEAVRLLPESGPSGLAGLLLAAGQAGDRAALVRAVEEGLDRLPLAPEPGHAFAFPAGAPPGPALALCLRGQTPELHATAVTCLMRLPSEVLAPAVEAVAAEAAVWPETLGARVLAAAGMGGRSRAPELLRLVRCVDLCGLLPRFAADLAARSQAPGLEALSALLAELDRRWVPPPGFR